MKRFIDIHVPISKCNLKCHYCYVAQENYFETEKTVFNYSSEKIGIALSQKRLGGVCHFNMCGMGETLIPKEIIDITRKILEQGHYVMIVTNGLLTKRFEAFSEFPEELRKRLGFKLSFHYLEMRDKNLLDTFIKNVDIIKHAKLSYSIEMTPNDEIEPYIDEIKKICMDNFGALCHITIPRDIRKKEIVLLSKHSLEEFVNIWSVFDSAMLKFKASTWGIKRKEYCYAGKWSGLLNIGTGEFTACYESRIGQNIFEDINKPISFIAVGKNCKIDHCYNSHSFLALGDIPEIKTTLYAEERNRTDIRDGSRWLSYEMNEFLSHRLEEYNDKDDMFDRVVNKFKKYKLYSKKVIKKINRNIS
ncbi:radical SAM protein [Clostridium botulinum]|nr:radical SAM protein [Clostridium botulinum]NFP01075.1 radical SAM protein [Clostridium botulinum]